ncbi:MAG: hypothetical protein GXO47_09695 [Chlorobi bacterium]|nr:hypothetical protein [Chlorobiota bacterium]
MRFDLVKWYNEKLQGNVILKYAGSISSDVIDQLLSEFETKVSDSSDLSKYRKKVYNVLVECLQNLYHHVDEPPVDVSVDEKDKYGAVVLCRDGSFFRISTGNFVKREKLSYIKDRIDQVNALSDQELKDAYRKILGNSEMTEKGGGGLGMLDIVRKTGNKLEYNFFQVDDDYIFFALDVYIS